MKLALKYTREDWIDGYKTYVSRGRRKWQTRFYVALGAFFLLVGLVVGLTPKNKFPDAIPLLLLGILWVYLGTLVWRRAGARAFSGRPELQQEYSIEIDDSGVSFSGSISSSRWTWPAFVGFLESKTTILLMLSSCMFVIFPKRIFGPGQVDQFRESVREKLPSK